MNKISTAKFTKAASGWVERQRHSLFKKIKKCSLEDTLGKGMAAHSSILAWRIPWTEKPVGLQSLEWQRVGHDWATNTFSGSNPQLEGVTKLQNGCFLWEARDSNSRPGTSTFKFYKGEISIQNTWLWKPKGSVSKKKKKQKQLDLHETELRLILLHAWTTVVNSLISFKRLCDDLVGWDGRMGGRF